MANYLLVDDANVVLNIMVIDDSDQPLVYPIGRLIKWDSPIEIGYVLTEFEITDGKKAIPPDIAVGEILMLSSTMFKSEEIQFTRYVFENIGDEIPMHQHDFSHVSIAVSGKFIAYDPEGKKKEFGPTDMPLLFTPGRQHAIQAIEAGAVLLNVQNLLKVG